MREGVFAVALGMVLLSGSTDAGSLSIAEPYRDRPSELPDDPPVSPEILARRATSARRVVSFGQFTSVQVNVNGTGDNIVGDAANEPTLAIDPTNPNRIVIAWRQFDSISSNYRQAGVAYSGDTGQTWTAGVIDPGKFRSDPVLGVDIAGNFYFSSLTCLDYPTCGALAVDVFKSTDGGATWPSTAYAYGGDKQWLVVDHRASGAGAGYIYQTWTAAASCCPPNDFTRSIDGAASFDLPIAMPSPSLKWGTLAVDSNGTLYLAGSNSTVTGHVFSRSTNARNAAMSPTFDLTQNIDLGGRTIGLVGIDSPNPVGLMGQVWVAVDPTITGRVYVLGSVRPAPETDPLDVYFIRSDDGGATWSAPVAVNDNPGDGTWQWFATMSVAPNGRIDAVWNDTRVDPTSVRLSQLFYSFSADGGLTWSPGIPVSPVFDSHLGFPNQSKIGDYYHMISDDAGANLAYAATFNGEEDVYFLRIPARGGQNTPTLSGIATAAMALLLLAAGAALIARRRLVSHCESQVRDVTAQPHAMQYFAARHVEAGN